MPEYGVLIEYFGMLDNPDYLAGTRKKQAVYRANGLDAVLLSPASFDDDWPEPLWNEIQTILADRLSRFQEALRAGPKGLNTFAAS